MKDADKMRRARRSSFLRRADLKPRGTMGGERERARRRRQKSHAHNVAEGKRLELARAEFVARVGDRLPSLQRPETGDA